MPAPCCARATNGHTAAPATRPANSRRFICPSNGRPRLSRLCRSENSIRHLLLAHELIAKSIAVRLNEPGRRMRKMDRQHKAARSRDLAEKTPARPRRLVGVPIEDRRPTRLATLQCVMHEVADDDGVLSARADIDAAMARGMARCRCQPE